MVDKLHLIFDFDGVLGNTWDARLKIIQEMDNKTEEEVLLGGERYFTKSTHTRAANLTESEIETMRKWSIEFGTRLRLHDFDLFIEFVEEISKIKNTKLAVVSSGSVIYLKPKLGETNLEFTHILGFEDHYSKEEKVENICKDWNVSVKDVYFITDTISDVVELENLLDKNKIYGCAWGYQGYSKLATVLKDDHIFKKYSDIHQILRSNSF